MEEMVEIRISHMDHTMVKNQRLERMEAQSNLEIKDLKTELFLSHNMETSVVKMVLSKYLYHHKEFSLFKLHIQMHRRQQPQENWQARLF